MAYGNGDESFQAAGGREGVRQLVDSFYKYMDTLPEAATIRAMHDAELTSSAEKLTVFLWGWLGGPKEYAAKFGSMRIPAAHAHLKIGEAERDAWLLCMQRAVDEQPFSDEFKAYFMKAIHIPAERVRVVSKDPA